MVKKTRITIKGNKRGQSFVELMIVTLILALIIVGVVEFGFLLNEYIHVLDGSREAARFSSAGIAFYPNGTSIDSFYVNTAIEAGRVMAPIHLDPSNGDDIIISVLSVAGSSFVRFPGPQGWSLCTHYATFVASFANPLNIPPALNDPSWSTCSPGTTHFSITDIAHLMDPIAPPSGVLLVEIYYNYKQMLKLPVFTSVIPDPIPVFVYSFMPISSAEPTPTPNP